MQKIKSMEEKSTRSKQYIQQQENTPQVKRKITQNTYIWKLKKQKQNKQNKKTRKNVTKDTTL